MKKSFIAMGTISVVAMLVAGCASTSSNRTEADALYEKFQTERPAVAAVNTGDQSLDTVAVASAKVYGSTVKYLDEYISATNNHRPYLGFLNEIEEKMKANKGLTAEKAAEMVLAEAKKDDEGKDPKEQVYPRIIAGRKAVAALKPTKKLEELAPLAVEAAKVASSAKGLVNSFSGFDPSTLKKLSSAKNIYNQADFSVKAIDFLNYRYQQEAKFEKHLQK